MKKLGLYKHKNCTDVAILVLSSFYVAERQTYKLKVRWMNIVNPNNIFDVGIQERLEIPRTKFNKEWELIG